MVVETNACNTSTKTNIPILDIYTVLPHLFAHGTCFSHSKKSKIEIRTMFHFMRKRIDSNIHICFVAFKMYKEQKRMSKVSGTRMSVDKVLALAKTVK